MIRKKRKNARRGCLVAIFILAVIVLPTCWFVIDIPFASHDMDREWARAQKNGFPLTADALKPAVPVRPEDNAAPLLKQALALVDARLDLQLQSLDKSVKAGGPTPTRREQILSRAAPALDVLAKAVEKPRLWADRDYDLYIEQQFPEYKACKGLVRALCVRAEERAATGDLAGAGRDLRVGRRLAALIATDPPMLARFVAMALDKMLDLRVERIAAGLGRNASALTALRKQAVEANPLHLDFRSALRTEMYCGLALTRNARRYGIGFGRREDTDSDSNRMYVDKTAPIERKGPPTTIFARASEARALEGWNDLLESSEWQSGDALAISRAEARIEADMDRRFTHRLSYSLIAVLFPVFSEAGKALLRAEAQRGVVDSLLKVLEYRARHGAFPKTLAAAGADAADPFAKGRHLLYLATSTSAKVWSVGVNGVDDGGNSKNDKDIVAMYPPRR
jgi:hypothetical protein